MTMVVAILQARTGREEALAAALREVAERTREEPGALAYAVGRQEGGGRFLVTERYADRRAREAHFASSYVTDLLARFPELLADEPQVEFTDVVTAFAR
ncbi:putative quinol monooxygenase [Kitasatospora sp. NPDC127067]|uniref:putative quinol monooxygenase n=1 Tax=Kitasatospora sp. NPDC127067 TaxID=3347126 RepID=UPI0036612078